VTSKLGGYCTQANCSSLSIRQDVRVPTTKQLASIVLCRVGAFGACLGQDRFRLHCGHPTLDYIPFFGGMAPHMSGRWAARQSLATAEQVQPIPAGTARLWPANRSLQREQRRRGPHIRYQPWLLKCPELAHPDGLQRGPAGQLSGVDRTNAESAATGAIDPRRKCQAERL